MNEEVPWLFLSHSGAQKGFTWRLYQELVHVGYHVFFDQDAQDSLPKGVPFPPRILLACRACKIGIVVLSHEYIESLWPMLELEQLSFHNPSAPNILYPLFYNLRPADLFNEDNLRRWKATWERKETEWQCKVQALQTASTSEASINISSWREALQKLRYQSGSVFFPHMHDHAYIEEIVSNIGKRLPPPSRYLLNDITGKERMQRDIDALFQQGGQKSSNPTSVVVVGVWGIGGTGKTTLCKNMLNYYGREFIGRSCLLELPTEQDQSLLVKAMKQVLLTLRRAKKEDLDNISSVEEIMAWLQEGFKSHPLFLALDNVCDWSIERANQIVSMVCMAGSKILVTGRSKQIVEKLLPGRNNIVHVPSITEEEAVEALKSFSFFLRVSPELDEYMRSLVRLCFFGEHCHSLLLKVMGAKIRHLGERMKHEQDWKDFISYLHNHPIYNEETILKVLEASLLALPPKLQNIFIDLVSCVPPYYSRTLDGTCKWLSMIYDGFTELDMRKQLIELEYHGLLEIKEKVSLSRIHDLRCTRELDTTDEWIETQYNLGEHNCAVIPLLDFRELDAKGQAMIEVQCDSRLVFNGKVTSWSKTSIRSHDLHSTRELDTWDQGIESQYVRSLEMKEVLSSWWEEPICIHDLNRSVARSRAVGRSDACFFGDLSHLSVDKCKQIKYMFNSFSSRTKEGTLRALKNCSKLEIFQMHGSGEFPLEYLHLSKVSMQYLRYLELGNCTGLKRIEGWEGTPNLVSVKLSKCCFLQNLGDMGCLQKLKEVIIGQCGSRCVVPNLTRCDQLKKLTFSCTHSLIRLASLGQPPNLQELKVISNWSLVDVSTVSMFITLQHLDLHGCSALKKIPFINFSNLLSLQLCGCRELKRLPNINARNLLTLNVEGCVNLQSLEGSVCSFIDMEELYLCQCYKMKKIPDLKNVARLKVFDADDCRSLKEVKVGVSSVTSLQVLRLRGCSSLAQVELSSLSGQLALELVILCMFDLLQQANQVLPCESSNVENDERASGGGHTINVAGIGSQSAAPLLHQADIRSGAFRNLRELIIEGTNCSNIASLDVSGLTSLEKLELGYFQSLQEIRGFSILAKLDHLKLYGCSSLKEITSQVASVDDLDEGGDTPVDLPVPAAFPRDLNCLCIEDCPSLTTLPPLPSASMTYLSLRGCSSLRDVSSLTSLIALDFLCLKGCFSLTELPNLTHFTNSPGIFQDGCPSPLYAPQQGCCFPLHAPQELMSMQQDFDVQS